MLIKCFDILTTLCQAVLFAWITNNTASRNNKLSRVTYSILIAVIFVDIITFTYISTNIPLSNLLMALSILVLIIIFYRSYVLDAFLGFSIAYSIIAITSYFLFMFYQHIFLKLGLTISSDLLLIYFIYLPTWLVYALVYKFRKTILRCCSAVKIIKQSLIFIFLIDLALILLDTLDTQLVTQSADQMFKAVLCFFAFAGFVFAAIYFASINDKAKEIELLNTALNAKIVELKKLKHDYGSEISSLYGLYQMGKIDRIGILLKGIVERYQGVSSNLNVSVQATPIVSSILSYALSQNVNVMAFDGGSYDNLSISENDLLKLLTNIVRNSVEVVKGIDNPTIKFKSYNSYNSIIITIENNGPEIPMDIREKIFETGFSTKGNSSSDRGYGLSIVRDVIKSCKGKISVDSNQERTQFKIEIPCISG